MYKQRAVRNARDHSAFWHVVIHLRAWRLTSSVLVESAALQLLHYSYKCLSFCIYSIHGVPFYLHIIEEKCAASSAIIIYCAVLLSRSTAKPLRMRKQTNMFESIVCENGTDTIRAGLIASHHHSDPCMIYKFQFSQFISLSFVYLFFFFFKW